MPASIPITRFRESLGPAFSEAIHEHRPQFIERNNREHGVLLGKDDVLRLLAGHEFHPEVFHEDGAVSIWLPEFGIYGRGPRFAEAVDDLLGEIRAYIDEFLDEPRAYLAAPNRAPHFGHVLKAALADIRGELRDVVFAEPREPT
jgi:Antitoxin of toxin-antitoxin, RelE / RelB, TA system